MIQIRLIPPFSHPVSVCKHPVCDLIFFLVFFYNLLGRLPCLIFYCLKNIEKKNPLNLVSWISISMILNFFPKPCTFRKHIRTSQLWLFQLDKLLFKLLPILLSNFTSDNTPFSTKTRHFLLACCKLFCEREL